MLKFISITGLLLAWSTFAGAATIDFSQAVSTSWNDPLNWVGNAVPGSTDHAHIPSSKSCVIDTSPTVINLTIDSGGTLTLAGDNTLTLDGDLTVDGTFFIGDSSAVPGTYGTLALNKSATSITGSGSISIADTTTTTSSGFSINTSVNVTIGGSVAINGNSFLITQQNSPVLLSPARIILDSASSLSLTDGSTLILDNSMILVNNTLVSVGLGGSINGNSSSNYQQGSSGTLKWKIGEFTGALLYSFNAVNLSGYLNLVRDLGYNPISNASFTLSLGSTTINSPFNFNNTVPGFDNDDFVINSSFGQCTIDYQKDPQNLVFNSVSANYLNAESVAQGSAAQQLGVDSEYGAGTVSYSLVGIGSTTSPLSTISSTGLFTPASTGETIRIIVRKTGQAYTSLSSKGSAEIYKNLSILAAQTVTDTTTYPSPIYYGDILSLTGTSTSNGALTWTTNNTAKLSITGSSASVIGIGSGVTVTASAPATSIYTAASSTPTALSTILAKPVTVTINGGTRTYGQTNPTPILTIPTLIGSDTLGTVTYSGPGATADITTAPGTYAISATFTNPNYNVTATGSLIITQATTLITLLDVTTLNQAGDTATLVATSSPTVAPITFSSGDTAIATVSGNTITAVSTGTVTITASFAGDANYAASSASIVVNIGQQVQTLTFPTIGSIAVGATHTAGATSSALLTPITYTSDNTAVATVNASTGVITGVSVGTAVITASQAGNASYTAATATQTVTVTAAPPVVTPPSVSGGGCGAGSGIALVLSLTGLSLLLRRRSL